MSQLVALAVGHITHDHYDGQIVAGGSAYYAARVWHGLGAHPRLLSCVGEDFACDAALEGLELHLSRGGKTTAFTNLYPPGGERQMYVESQAPHVSPELLPEEWSTPELLFLAPVLGEVPLEPWLNAIDTQRTHVVLGLQGWLKTAGEGSGRRLLCPRDWSPPDLEGVALACLSREDLFGRDPLLEQLVATVSCVVVTEGSAGCVLYEGAQETHVGVYPTTEVDPTGAGDSFAAAMGWAMARGASCVEAARWGAAAASVVVESQGGGSLHRVDEAAQRVEHMS